ncbi:MAG: hydrogenase nickel incorporation protein HypB [Bacteroidetes bacterium]|nr:hydrogenase nickel incorporation protein HypB [Bacteroidota bacterium]
MAILTVERKVFEKNDNIASEIRASLKQNKTFTLNFVSSPGSGKTTLLEQTITRLQKTHTISVIEGDVQTDIDAQRIDKLGVPVSQIMTNGSCHLDADMVREAYQQLASLKTQFLFIENVGNLICTADFDLGEDFKVAVLSTTEGEEKPLKYPVMFREAKVLIINKMDLVPYLGMSPDSFRKNALSINPDLIIFEVSAKTGEGIDAWVSWLKDQVK